jgi:HSP20 family protein
MSALTKWDPFRELDVVQNRFANLFGRSLLPSTIEEAIGVTAWSPLVDVLEEDKEYVIKAELPDVKKDDVKVTVENGALHISGERKFEKEEKGRKYHRIERAYGSFDRVFVLPEATKADEISAEFKHGILEVRLPKSEADKPKALEVKVG